MNKRPGLLAHLRGSQRGGAVALSRRTGNTADTRASGHGWLRRLAGYCGRYRRDVIITVAGALAGTAATAAIPLVQRSIIDNVIVTHKQSIWPLAGLLLVAAAVNFASVYLRRYHGGRLSLDVQHDLRTGLFGSLSRLDGARQDEIRTGQLVGRSISDLNMVQGLLSMAPITIGNIALFVVSLIVMVILSPLLTLVTLAVAPALYLIALASRRRLFPASWDAQQQSAEVVGLVDEAIGGVRVVKGFGQEEQEQEQLEGASAKLFAARLRMIRLTARYNPALTAIPSLGLVGVLALGGWLAIQGSITLGTFLAFAAYLALMTGPVRMLTYMITLGQEARASVIRVFDIIDSRPVITDRPDAAELPEDAAGLSFDDVRFGYKLSEPVLRGVSFQVEPGETVAVVGASGSGKSTLAMLLPRFYDPQGGSVRIGGHNVAEVTRESLRAAIGLVMEDSFLFSTTVRANIAYGRPDATDEAIVAAARAAQAHEFIVRLPEGYDTVVGEQGLTLSGGQRQRVALARALITDPRVLVLDDATSAIDPRLEAEIHTALREIMRGRTTLVIAHRRSTLNLADRIVVLDGGRVADIGTHDELTERCPLYRQLITGEDETGLPLIRPRQVRTVEDALDGQDQVRAAARAARGYLSGTFESVPPSPELLAQVAALPPARDVPDVDIPKARAADRHFTLRRLLRPLAAALVIGLLLDGLDALAGLALPALVRDGIDNGVQAKVFHAIVVASLIGLAIVLADWVVRQLRDDGGRAQRRTAAVHPAGQAVRAAAAAGPGLLRARDVGPDHDQDDHGRRRAVHLPADRRGHHGQLGAHLLRCAGRAAHHQPAARPGRAVHLPGAGGGDDRVPGQVIQGVRRVTRESGRGQRRLRGERGRDAGDPGVPPGGRERGPVQRAQPGIPGVAAAGAAVHRAVLPVRADPVHGGRRDRPGHRHRRGRRRDAHRGRADRLPAVHRHGLRPHPAALPGLRRIPAGHGRAAADH